MKKEWKKPELEILDVSLTMKGISGGGDKHSGGGDGGHHGEGGDHHHRDELGS